MNNKERILSITYKNSLSRINRITSILGRRCVLQIAKTYGKYSWDLVNIIFPALRQKNRLVLMAHHDVYPGSYGYNDNSTGVTTLLRLKDDLPDNVELVFTDGEEVGGQGCRRYVETCRRNGNADFEAINLDVVGLGDRIFYEQYGGVSLYNIPKHMEYFRNVSFSDSRVLDSFGIPNILMLTGRNKDELIKNISESQHGNVNDGRLDLISEQGMDRVFETLLRMIRKQRRLGSSRN